MDEKKEKIDDKKPEEENKQLETIDSIKSK